MAWSIVAAIWVPFGISDQLPEPIRRARNPLDIFRVFEEGA